MHAPRTLRAPGSHPGWPQACRPLRPAARSVHRPWLATALVGAALLTCAPGQAQAQAGAAMTQPSGQSAAAYNEPLAAFGQREGLARLAMVLVDRAKADSRIGHFFKDVSAKHLSQQLADQFCALLSGPCVYDGQTMKKSHQDLKIARKDFLALVELLQQAMDDQGIAFGAQNRLLALLAPMHREVIAP